MTHDLTLLRVRLTQEAVYGVLMPTGGGAPFAVTLERPWLDNAVRKSCIPEGTYECRRVKSPKFGNTFEVTKVPGRSAILFHAGNTADDSLGCILVGHGFDPVKGKDGVVSSTKEFGEFLKRQHGSDTFTLTVKAA